MSKLVAVVGAITIGIVVLFAVVSWGSASSEQSMAFNITTDYTNQGVNVQTTECLTYGTDPGGFVCDLFYVVDDGVHRRTVWAESYEDGSWEYLNNSGPGT